MNTVSEVGRVNLSRNRTGYGIEHLVTMQVSSYLTPFHCMYIRGIIANAHIKIGSNSYEEVKTFKYLGSLLTNQNSI